MEMNDKHNIYVRDLDIDQLRRARLDMIHVLIGPMDPNAREHADATMNTVEGELFRRYREGTLNS
jgi:hypothetical protein